MTTPTREDVIRMAREAGFRTGTHDYADGQGTMPFVEPIGTTCLVEVENLVKAAYAAGAAAREEFKQVYRCKIKSRWQINKEIPREQQGWWADVAAGQKLLLRQAVQSDIDRCTLGENRSKNPDDYMCETHTGGGLVSKAALEYMNPEQNVFAAIRARSTP